MVAYFRLLLLNLLAFVILTSNTLAIETLTPKKSSKHTEMIDMTNLIYMIPPDKSFEHISEQGMFGFRSEKYNTFFKLVADESTVDIAEERFRQSFEVLKEVEVIINDINMSYFKLRPRYGDQGVVQWLMFASNPFFEFLGQISYDKKYDKTLSNKIEIMFKSLIVIPNPTVTPQRNAFIEADYDMIKPLKFVQKMSIPVGYWTEDGLPIIHTEGSKYLAIATAPVTNLEDRDIAVLAFENANIVLDINKLNDSVIIENIDEIEFMRRDGIKMQGSLKSDDNKSVMLIFARSKTISYLLMAVCNKEEKEVFFNNIWQFKDSVVEIFKNQ